jgi:hypothetical protein
MAYKNRKAYKARRGIKKAQSNIPSEDMMMENAPVESSGNFYTQMFPHDQYSGGDKFEEFPMKPSETFQNPRKGFMDRLTTEGPISAISGTMPVRYVDHAATTYFDELGNETGLWKKGGQTGRGGVMKVGGAVKSSNVMKGNLPKAKKGGARGGNKVL